MNLIKYRRRIDKVTAILTLTLVSITAFSVPALANSKRYSGAGCQPSTPSDLQKLVRGEGYIYNSSTSYAYVACPIEWEFPQDTSGSRPYIARVKVLKYNSQTLTCRLSSYSTVNDALVDSKSASTNLVGTGEVRTAAVAQSSYYGMFCNLPPSSGINGYVLFDD